MVAGMPKQFVRPPPKKKPQKAASLDTVDDFQEAADHEESAGGKHRVGDPGKSGRAFVRALDIYDRGLQKWPNSFDLAYNKARLQLELSQQPNLLEHIRVTLLQWLQTTLISHRHALRLNQENPDVLFNSAQVLISLAEELLEEDHEAEASPLLSEALELLSSCMSRQEMMFEQHKIDFPDNEDGGVALDPDEKLAPEDEMDTTEEQSATVEIPVTANDLLDTFHASISALTTFILLADQPTLQTFGDMAKQLTESKAAGYILLLPTEEQRQGSFAVAVAWATFVAAFSNRQFEFQLIAFHTYLENLDYFNIPGKEDDITALCSEAEARTQLVLSAIDFFSKSQELPATTCWKQLTIAQDLYSNATRLTNEEAQSRKAEVYQSKGDLELLRHRIANISKAELSGAVVNSAQTLIRNAQTYYKGAASHSKSTGDEDAETEALNRRFLANMIAATMYSEPIDDLRPDGFFETLHDTFDEGLIAQDLADALERHFSRLIE